MRHIILRGFSRRPAHGKSDSKLRDEARHQLVRIRVECHAQNLQTARTVFLLNAAQNLSGVLAVRSSGEQERQQNHLARVLAQQ